MTPSPYWPRSTREQRKTSESFLLSTKTETQYGTAPLSREKATRAMRAAENLAVRARQTHAAHFMSSSKKEIVEIAIREYIDNHRDEINASVRAALAQLNGSAATAVAALSGVPEAEFDDFGGFPS